MTTRAAALFIATAILAAPPALADKKQSHDHAGHTQLGAHEHGHGKLNIAIEGKTLSMELEIPADDIVGFEHAAETKEQKAKLADGRAKLGRPLALFLVNAEAQCKLTSAEVEAEGAIGDADHGHSHGNHDHGKKQAEAEGAHSEFHATYTLACANPKQINSIEFAFFKTFPNSKELEVALVGDRGTQAFQATPQNTKMTFGGAS